jgi:dihydrofolate synthase/folylpolyglutamate synthase
MNMLGNTLEEIAFEKAGIIKPSIPVVIGERQEETYAVFEKVAQQKQAPIFFATDQFKPIAYKWKGKTISVEILNQSDFQVSTFESDLPGIYQTKNICTVLTSLKLMTENGFIIPDKAIAAGLASVKKTTGLQGRWEVIHERPTIVLEVAHNKEGIEQMIKHLNNLSFDQLHIILGTVKDKDPGKVLEILPKQAHYYFTHAHIPRALDALTLKEQANTYSLVGDHYDHVNTALVQAIKNASEQDMIIVCGSIFLVAEVDRTLVGQKS